MNTISSSSFTRKKGVNTRLISNGKNIVLNLYMKVLHYIPSIDRESGGVGSYMQLLAKPLGNIVELHVATHQSKHELQLENCQIHYLNRWTSYFKLRRQWQNLLDQINPDVVHVNCCWQPECAFVQKWSSKRGVKTVYTPHGMLEPWIMNRHYLTRKVPALMLYQKTAIENSDVVHATAESERQHIAALGYNFNIEVIPNGIDISQIRMKNCWRRTKTFLFLSRIHEKKGLELLINAVAELKDEMKGYRVLIAGEGDSNYIVELKTMANKKGVDDYLEFIGGVYGDKKWELYRQADVFVLPTYSENFGIVVAEALASGTPVITTTGTPWEELMTKHCGWWVPCTQKNITFAVRSALNATDAKLQMLGANGRKLMETNYSVEKIGEKMKALYGWILGLNDKPDYVYV